MSYSALEILDLSRYLVRREEALAEAVAKFSANLADLGPAYAVRWASESLRLEAELKASRAGADFLAAGESPAVAAESLRARALRQLDYLVPSNSDLAADIYFAQSLGRLAVEFAGAARSADRAAGPAGADGDADALRFAAVESAFVAGAVALVPSATEEMVLAEFAAWAVTEDGRACRGEDA